MVLLDGEKEFLLFPFSDAEYLYPVKHDALSSYTTLVNVTHPDLSRFPKFLRAKPYRVRSCEPRFSYDPEIYFSFSRFESRLGKRFICQRTTSFRDHLDDVYTASRFWWHQVSSFGRNIAINFWYSCHSNPFGNLAFIHLYGLLYLVTQASFTHNETNLQK